MVAQSKTGPVHPIKEPGALSPRIQQLRSFYFDGMKREWNNEFTCWTTGTPWDLLYDETTYHIVPETYAFFPPFRASALQAARPVELPGDFWSRSLVERRAWFIHRVMTHEVPKEILPDDLLAGARFNILASRCFSKREAKLRGKKINGRNGATQAVKWFHDHGYGNAGATSGHLIPDHRRALEIGWKGIHADLEDKLGALDARERSGRKGAQLKAMMIGAEMPRDLAAGYATLCRELAAGESREERAHELNRMADNLQQVPWEPPKNFWEAVQALWINHMLVMSDENYPGPGVSFGRLDQILLPHWQASIEQGMEREFGKEILR